MPDELTHMDSPHLALSHGGLREKPTASAASGRHVRSVCCIACGARKGWAACLARNYVVLRPARIGHHGGPTLDSEDHSRAHGATSLKPAFDRSVRLFPDTHTVLTVPTWWIANHGIGPPTGQTVADGFGYRRGDSWTRRVCRTAD